MRSILVNDLNLAIVWIPLIFILSKKMDSVNNPSNEEDKVQEYYFREPEPPQRITY